MEEQISLPDENFFKDLGECDIINLGSGVGAVAMEMLSSLFVNLVLVISPWPFPFEDSNRNPVNCGSSR